ncbi:Unknown protein, partial [Striga hermonthica]
TKRARRKRKAKVKESCCWCKPCTRKERSQKKEAKRRGLRWVKDGWWIPAEDCERLKGWDPWPEATETSGEKQGDGDRLMDEGRASAHDARGWTYQDDDTQAENEQATVIGDRRTGETGAAGMPPRREPEHQELPQATVVAHFLDYHPEKFSGQGDPRIVDEWVLGLEMIFEVMDYPDRYRMLCAQIQLTGDARLWWNAYWSMRPGQKQGCTWNQFKELIRGKYYPSYYRADMERQFLALRQGTRSVDECEREFTRLGSF